MIKRVWIVFIAVLGLFACTSGDQQAAHSDEKKKVQVVATTGMIGDLLKNILPEEDVEIISLMKPGIDPHYYKATPGDLVAMQKADLIVYNGLHLEGKMTEIFHKLSKRKTVLSLSEFLDESDIRKTSEFASGVDPHIWFDVLLWKKVTALLGLRLSKEYPQLSKSIEQNSLKYQAKLETLHGEIVTALTSIPEKSRVLLTAHDAFAYFGRAYAIDVRGLQGISTSTEYGLKDMEDAVALILEKSIKAVFVESSVSPKALQAVVERCQSKGHVVRIGGELFSDSMGDENTVEGSYLGMLRHNVHTIVAALK